MVDDSKQKLTIIQGVFVYQIEKRGLKFMIAARPNEAGEYSLYFSGIVIHHIKTEYIVDTRLERHDFFQMRGMKQLTDYLDEMVK